MTKAITTIIVIALVIGGVWYYQSNKPVSVTGEPVKIGVIAGTTGQYAPAGEAYVKGFNLALEEWNSSHEQKFTAVIEDDGFDPAKGLAAYKKISSLDKVEAYAILSSFTIDSVYDLVHAENKPVALGFEQSKPAEDDNIFQVLPAAKPVQFALGQEVKKLGYKKVAAAVSNNTSVYQNFYDGFKDGYSGEVKKFDVGSDVAGIRSQALAISAGKPDVIAFFMAPQDGALLVKELLKIYSSSERPFFVFDQSIQSGSTDYTNILGADFSKINNSLVSMSKNDFTPNFTSGYKAKYNTEPPFGSDMGYNSFMLLANTYDKSSGNWIKNMEKVKFAGADGEVYFDEVGLRVPNIFFGKLDNGKIVK